MKKVNKILCAGFASMVCVLSLTGCGQKGEEIQVISCVADEEESKGMWYEFVLAEDGKTVNQFVNHIGVDRDFMINNLVFEDGNKLETEEELEWAWTFLSKYYSGMIDNFISDIEESSWLLCDWDGNIENLTLELVWGVDLTDESLDLEDETTRNKMDVLFCANPDVFYNESEKCYQVSADLLEENLLTGDEYNLLCSNKIVKNVDDLEFNKLLKRVEENKASE